VNQEESEQNKVDNPRRALATLCCTRKLADAKVSVP